MLKYKDYFIKGFNDWRKEFYEHRYLILMSLIIVVIATFIDYSAGYYVSKKAETAGVPDLILDHLDPVNAGFLFVYGYIILCLALFSYPLFFHIRTLHIVISQFSFLIMLRAIFIVFTHLQTPPDAIQIGFPWIFKGLSFQNDQFFSGHTAIPFLGFLLFKGGIRYFFLLGSAFMGIIVLLTHQHYSIDVFAAFFITYCCYKMGDKLINSTERWVRS
jgi:hypothetical protein